MRWIFRRILLLVFTLVAAITINFFLIRLMPGNPVDALLNELITQGYSYEEALTRVAQIISFVPNAPIHEQYIDFVKGLMRGDLGRSIRLAQPVSTILGYALPWTVFSMSISMVISFGIGVLLGMYMAYHRGSIVDRAMSLYSSVSGAIPAYAVGFFLVLIFAIQLKWLPPQGPYAPQMSPPPAGQLPSAEFILSVLRYAILPITTYVVTTVGGWTLRMKSSTVSVLGEYYVTAAEARGLSDRRIVLTYVGRNAMLPLFAQFAIAIGLMFSGVVFIENIFLYPGIGRFFFQSISWRDYPLTSGCFVVISVAVVFANFLADLLYSRLDPRVKFE